MAILTATGHSRTYDVLVDDEWYLRCLPEYWQVKYSPRDTPLGVYRKRGEMQLGLHRIVMGVAGADWHYPLVDHINRDVFDNRRENLRLASHSENAANRWSSKPEGNATGRKGVRKVVRKDGEIRWASKVTFLKTTYRLGTFLSPDEAAAAYDLCAREIHGEFAYTNCDHRLEMGEPPIPGCRCLPRKVLPLRVD